MQKPLEYKILISKGGETIPFDSMNDEEKAEVARHLERRHVKACANAVGYEAIYPDEESNKTGTA